MPRSITHDLGGLLLGLLGLLYQETHRISASVCLQEAKGYGDCGNSLSRSYNVFANIAKSKFDGSLSGLGLIGSNVARF